MSDYYGYMDKKPLLDKEQLIKEITENIEKLKESKLIAEIIIDNEKAKVINLKKLLSECLSFVKKDQNMLSHEDLFMKDLIKKSEEALEEE
jgi:RNase adaptor protein for sRNA GlmZ degradation